MPTTTERWSDRQYSPGVSASRGFDVLFSATETVTETAAVSAVATLGVTIGASHPFDNRLIGSAPSVSYSGPRLLSVSYPYVRNTGGGSTPPQEQNPLDEPAIIRTTFNIVVEPAERDAAGNPLVNSVGDLFEGATREIVETVFRISRNQSTYDINHALAYTGTVNDAPFQLPGGNRVRYTIPRGWARCLSILPDEFREGDDYVTVTYEIAIRTPLTAFEASGQVSLFDYRFLDQGPNGLSNAGPGLWCINGQPVVLRMNGRGRPFDARQDPKINPVALSRYIDGKQPTGSVLEDAPDGVFIWFARSKRMDFSGLTL